MKLTDLTAAPRSEYLGQTTHEVKPFRHRPTSGSCTVSQKKLEK